MAVAKSLEPRDVCDSSSGVGTVTNGNRAAELIGPPDNKLRKPGKTRRHVIMSRLHFADRCDETGSRRCGQLERHELAIRQATLLV